MGLSMALSDIEKEWVTEIVVNTANVTAEKVAARFIEAHVLTCPYGKQMMKWMCIAIGIGIGIGLGGNALIDRLMSALPAVLP